MASNLDKSLDEILSSRRTGGRAAGRRGGVVAGVRKRPQRAAAVKAAAAVTQATSRPFAKATSAGHAGNTENHSKIIVSNLPLDVTEQMIKEYFSKVVGPVKSCVLTYGPNGQSRGIATISFVKIGDADKAAAKYNGVLVDKRPMKVELVVEPKPITLADRVGPPNKAIAAPPPKQPRGSKPTTNAPPRGPKPVRGRGRGRAGRPGGRKPKTAEELDAEMTDYWAPHSGNVNVGAHDANGTANYNGASASAGDAMMDDQIMVGTP